MKLKTLILVSFLTLICACTQPMPVDGTVEESSLTSYWYETNSPVEGYDCYMSPQPYGASVVCFPEK